LKVLYVPFFFKEKGQIPEKFIFGYFPETTMNRTESLFIVPYQQKEGGKLKGFPPKNPPNTKPIPKIRD
jgi:hypothetical protein